MKKRLLPVALLFGTMAANAQVGIGTATPNKSAELLIESSNRGLLIPNVALTSTKDKQTITNGNVQSLLVYATKAQGDVTPGYYYWDINVWKRLTADADIPQIVVNNFQEIVNKDGDKVQNIIKNIVKNTEGNVIYEGDKFYTFTKDGDKVVKQEIKDKLTSIVYEEATGDYIYYNEGAVDRNGKIIGEGIRIKVKETVINKFGDIINNKTVQEHITNYLDGTYVGGNVYYEGDKLTYVTKEGERKEVSINQVITANESKTAIISVNKKQYYVSEEYLVANKGVVPTTVDAANLPKGIYAIDVVGGVVNNLEEIVNKGPVTVDGRTFKTVNDYITYLTESKGGFTKIVYDQSIGDVIFQEWDETTQKYVNVDNSKFSTIVKGNETVTTLVDKGDGTFTYTDEKGKTVSFDSNKTTVEMQNGVYTFKDGKGGVITTIDTNAKAIGYDNSVSGIDAKNVQDALDKLAENLGKGAGVKLEDKKDGKVTLVANNGDVLGSIDKSKLTEDSVNKGLFTFTRNDGTDVLFDVNTVNVSESKDADGNVLGYDFKDSKGNVITTVKTAATNNYYDNSVSGIDAKNVQDALDKLAENLGKGAGVKLEDKKDGKVTLVANNGDLLGSIDKSKLTEDALNKGLFTFTRNDGTDVLFDVNTVNVSESKDADGNVLGYDFKDSKGNVITTVKTAATNNYYDNSVSGIDAKNVQDALDKLAENLGKGAGVKLEDKKDGKVTLVANNGDLLGSIDKSKLTEDALNKGLFTFTRNDGTDVLFDVNTVNVSESKDADGNVLGYDFKDSKGNVITTVKTAATNNYYDNSVSGIDAKNVQDALDKLAENLGKGAGVKLEDKKDGKVTLVANNGDLLGSIDKSKLTEDALNKGLFTFTRNDGTDVLFDVNTVNVSDSKDADGNVLGYDFKDSKGNVITTVKTAATNNYYDNSVSGIDAKNVQDALDKLAENLGKGAGVKLEDKKDGKVTLVANNGDLLGSIDKSKLTEDALNKGLFTFTRNDGTDVLFDVNTVNVSDSKDADGNVLGYDFKDSKGNVITTVKTAATNNYYDNSVSGIDAKNVQDALDKLVDKITTVEETSGDLVVSGGLEFIAKTTGVKALLVDANIQVADKGIKTDKLDDKSVTNEKLDDKSVTNEKLDDKSVSADKMTSFTSDNGTTNPVAEGQIPVADGKGGVTYKEISGETLKGKALTSGSITVIGGEKALLDTTKIEVTGGKNKGDVLVTTDKPLTNDKGEVVKDKEDNTVYVTEWVNPKDFVSGTVTAKNGITVVNDKEGNSEFKLGGALTEPKTSITTTDKNVLAIEGLANIDKPVTAGNNLVIADKDGVLKQTSAKNLIEDAITDGKLEAKQLKGAGITVTAGVNEGTDTSVASSLLKDVTLGIANGAVTSDKMKATVVDGNGGPKNAEAGMVPVANADGTVTYKKVDAKDVTYTKPTTDNGLTSNTVEGAINELAGKKGDLKVAGGMLTINDGGKDALRHDATISLNLEGMNAIVETKVDYTAKVEDVIVLAIAESKDLVVTLPDAVANKGKKYTIKKHDAKEDFYVTVKGNIVGASELYTALPYSGWDLVSDGTQWQIVNKF